MKKCFMRCWVRFASLLLALVLSSACSILPKSSGDAPQLFQLSAMDTSVKSVTQVGVGRHLPWQVVVQPPLAALSIDTNRIAVLTSAHEVRYLRGVRWSDNAPQLVQEALVEALDATDRFAAVGRASGGLRTDYSLICELRDFQADTYSGGQPIAKIRMMLQLVKQPSGIVAASRTFSSETESEGRSTLAIVRAFDTGLQGLMGQVGDWAASSLPSGARSAEEAALSHRSTRPQRKASRDATGGSPDLEPTP